MTSLSCSLCSGCVHIWLIWRSCSKTGSASPQRSVCLVMCDHSAQMQDKTSGPRLFRCGGLGSLSFEPESVINTAMNTTHDTLLMSHGSQRTRPAWPDHMFVPKIHRMTQVSLGWQYPIYSWPRFWPGQVLIFRPINTSVPQLSD